ncbi:MAG TPA: nuclear transport factor 2 family protein [Acidiferrobacterales bacterium]|nr:nuclear transport factor 2 family protein [Acidiferrobacterales bacterium]
MNPKDVVQKYHAAWAGHDLATVRSLLHDNVDFKGPIDTFNKADDLVASLKKLDPMVKEVKTQKEFVDGAEVCSIFDLVTVTGLTAPIAEWFRVEGGKIVKMRVIFDARPFAPAK